MYQEQVADTKPELGEKAAGEVYGGLDLTSAPHDLPPIIPENTSNFMGVEKKRHRWRASLKVDGKTATLGIFPTAQQAALIYARAKYAKETRTSSSGNDPKCATEFPANSGPDTLSGSHNSKRPCQSRATKMSSKKRRVSFDLEDNDGDAQDDVKPKRVKRGKRRKLNYHPHNVENKKLKRAGE